MSNYFLDGDPVWLKKLEEKKTNFLDWLNKASQAALTTPEKTIIEAINLLYKTYESERYRAKQLYESGKAREAKNILLKDMWGAFEALYQKCEDYIRIVEDLVFLAKLDYNPDNIKKEVFDFIPFFQDIEKRAQTLATQK